jgi:hypothetical protein
VEISTSQGSGFERARFKGAFVMTLSDTIALDANTARLFKVILGREDRTFAIKYKQVDESLVTIGFVIATSNVDANTAVAGIHDSGLLDRIIEFHFPFVPAKPIPVILKWLQRNTAAIINWGISCPKVALERQIRVGTLESFRLAGDLLSISCQLA